MVPADDAAHRRVRLERRGVNRDGLTLQTAGLDESLLHPRKDGPVRLQIDQAPRARNRRMIGWRLVHGQPQQAADRQRVRRAPRHPAFRVDAFEVADQQQAEVAPGCQARSAHHGRVEPVTQAFDEPIDVVPVEQRRQPRVERMARRGGQVRRRDPQRRLIRLARSHSHARQCSTTDRLCRSLITPTFTTGPWRCHLHRYTVAGMAGLTRRVLATSAKFDLLGRIEAQSLRRSARVRRTTSR